MLRYSTKTVNNSIYYNVLKFFSNRRYSKQHEWVVIEKDIATVGITDYAQNELGEIVHCDLPKAGDKIKAGESLVNNSINIRVLLSQLKLLLIFTHLSKE